MFARTKLMRFIVACVSSCLLLAGAPALAAPLNAVSVGDLPGTNGQWQTGEVTVAAPQAEVWRWFTEVNRWPERFPDDAWARDLGRTPDGRQLAELRSNALGRTLKLEMREQPGVITYTGTGKGVTTQGKIFVQAVGPNTTRVIMQTTGELHGAIGFFAGEGTKRKRAIKKLSSDLQACVRIANSYAAARRHGG